MPAGQNASKDCHVFVGDYVCWFENGIQIYCTKTKKLKQYELNSEKQFGKVEEPDQIDMVPCNSDLLYRAGLALDHTRKSFDKLDNFLQIYNSRKAIILDLQSCEIANVVPDVWKSTESITTKKKYEETGWAGGFGVLIKFHKQVQWKTSRLGNIFI